MRIRASALGGDFPRERFVRTPIQAIADILQYLDSEEQRLLNLQSAAVGKLGVQMAYIAWGMSGGKGKPPDIKIDNFFPFPDWKPLKKQPGLGPSSETVEALAELFRKRQIPPHVYVSLRTPPEDGR